MTECSIISTETWRFCLPRDWVERESSTQGSVYFEASDGTKGAYLSTWRITDKGQTIQEELASFRRVELRALEQMEGCVWAVVAEWTADPPPVAISGVDCLAGARSYRIVCQLLGSPPWVVRASFHDYDCTDYEVSKRFFQPIIDSLEIHNEVV